MHTYIYICRYTYIHLFNYCFSLEVSDRILANFPAPVSSLFTVKAVVQSFKSFRHLARKTEEIADSIFLYYGRLKKF